MNILYITPFKIDEENASSGTVNSVRQALIDAGNTVFTIDNLKVPVLYSFFVKVVCKLSGKHIDINREPYVLKQMNKEIEKRALEFDYDIVFSQTSILCAYYRGSKKIVFYTDATFGGMLGYYWDADKWMSISLKHGNEVERAALCKCDKAIYASAWAVDTAVKCHGASRDKCVVINRGANVHHDYSFDDIKRFIDNRSCIKKNSPLNFLFVGRDWIRKERGTCSRYHSLVEF